ncbi:hypothetical protein Pfo_001542 [Paulownia fortunei]|nr:hypothetical protein Pfo_001542 [Paulownia fortunei]
MTRKKVTLAYITNDSERKASFKKRKKGLIKKVSELSTLCGVEACAIIYSQYDPEPEVWPSRLGAQAVLARFRKMSEMDQTRKMVNQESFTRQRIKKAEDQLRRAQKENKRREMENFMFQCLAGMVSLEHFDLHDAAEMGWVINQILRDINSRMEALKRDGQHHQDASASAAEEAAVAPPQPVEEVAPLTAEENMESFPWNLVESPTGAGGSGLGGRGLGWDDGMVLPYPYIFNHANSTTSAAEPGTSGPGAN